MESNINPRQRFKKVEDHSGSTPPASNSTPSAQFDPNAPRQTYAIAIRNALPDNPHSTSPAIAQPKKASEPTEVQNYWDNTATLVRTPISLLQTGQIFRAVFEHPHHQKQQLYPRYYLVVGHFPVKDPRFPHLHDHEFCVVGLETNGGQGRYCYEGDRLRFIKDIKEFASYSERDRNSFYIAKGQDWSPRENTVVDLTTVLKVRSKFNVNFINVETIADLADGSKTQIDRCYTALATPPPANFSSLMTTKTQKVSRAREDDACRCCYCRRGKLCPLPRVFGKQKTGQTYSSEELDTIVGLYNPNKDNKFWSDMSHEI